MNKEKAKIFLSGERGFVETQSFRSYKTLNFGDYQHRDKAAVGPLYGLNDDTLAAGRNTVLTVEENSMMILIPLAGAVRFKASKGYESIVQPGNAQMIFLTKGELIEFINPFATELINFLHIWIKTPGVIPEAPLISEINVKKKADTLLRFGKGKAVPASICTIGKFSGRSDATYTCETKSSNVFVFIIQGSFEVANRMLETRDGLALWNVNEIDFVALSDEAIILFVETTL